VPDSSLNFTTTTRPSFAVWQARRGIEPWVFVHHCATPVDWVVLTAVRAMAVVSDVFRQFAEAIVSTARSVVAFVASFANGMEVAADV